jgi:Domain of unknown function (DUF6378)
VKPTEVLRKAAEAVERGTALHGDTKRSFELIAQLWGVYISHSMAIRKQVSLTPFDVANMMIMVKQARSIYGNSPDNQVDIAGYAALAAALGPSVEDQLAKEIGELNVPTSKAL